MIALYSVALLKGKEVVHCDLIYEDGKIKLERLASKGLGRSRRGLSKSLDLFLYKIEKERTKSLGLKEVIEEMSIDEIKCWRVEEHKGRGLGREYLNTVLFILKTRDGKVYRMFVSKKAYKVLEELIKKMKKFEIERCRRV